MNKRYGMLIVSVTILVLCSVGTASATTWSVDGSGWADFIGIQAAINNASDGDTIIVHSGVYYENVVVNKSVTLIGNGQPVVDAGGEGSAITLCADGITLIGSTATNSGNSWGCAGIKVSSSNNIITGNNVCNNKDCGIYLGHSNNNTITGNNVRSNSNGGIYLSGDSSNSTITGNNVSNNNRGGIGLGSSSKNTITGNTFVNDGLRVYGPYQNVVEGNIVNGKSLIYLEDALDYKVEDAGQVILVNCTNITVENLDLSNTSVGVELWNTKDSKVLNNTVSNNTGSGISLYESSNNNTITDNNVCNNRYGICLEYSSNNNIITGNNVRSNNRDGIRLRDSSNNTITWNNASSNGGDIYLSDSHDNTITGNNVNNNGYGIRLDYSSNNNTITGNVFVNDGLSVSGHYQNVVEDNTVNDKPLVYLVDASDYKVEDAGQVILVNCTNITVENLDLSNTSGGIELWKTENSRISSNNVNNNGYGIHLDYSSNNTITWNNASSNGGGIYLFDSHDNIITGNNVSNNNWSGIRLYDSSNNNTITGNNVRNNNWRGIHLWDSSNNKIYFNNFINNTYSVKSQSSTNIWNSPLEITYTYDGTIHKSYLGNYWDGYEGTDAEGDGIGDTHYSIDSEKDESDEYPLMKPFENYILPTSAYT